MWYVSGSWRQLSLQHNHPQSYSMRLKEVPCSNLSSYVKTLLPCSCFEIVLCWRRNILLYQKVGKCTNKKEDKKNLREVIMKLKIVWIPISVHCKPIQEDNFQIVYICFIINKEITDNSNIDRTTISYSWKRMKPKFFLMFSFYKMLKKV